MNHFASARLAAQNLDSDARWQSWAARAEDMLGQPLEGALIDGALSAFAEGASVVEYVLDVKGRQS